jgi:hypothetical protein
VETIVAALVTGAATVAAALIAVRAGRPSGGEAAVPPAGRRELRNPFSRLPALTKRRRLWVAGVVGFLFSGIGVALYFRTLPDALLGALLSVPFWISIAVQPESGSGEPTSTPWWYWPFAVLTALYCVLRADEANRRPAA